MLSLTLLRIHTDSFQEAQAALEKSILQAPDFFNGIPVVLEPRITLDDERFLPQLLDYLKAHGLLPIGIRTDQTTNQAQATTIGLPLLPLEQRKSTPPSKSQDTPSPQQTALVINSAIRSGQQIYAKGRDLIIRGAVNPGAEVAADGNIHIYGKVRGKVFAGSGGDTTTRIFAQELDPELVCIAGFYQLADNIEPQYKSGFTEIALQEEHLVFNTLNQGVTQTCQK